MTTTSQNISPLVTGNPKASLSRNLFSGSLALKINLKTKAISS
jgi:hypothetical protein